MRPIRVLRVIARLNVGGATHHVALIGRRMDPERYPALLVHGRLGRGEASLAHLADGGASDVRQLPELRPEVDPRADLRAVGALRRVIDQFRPDVVETHTAKAGFVGRAAAASSRPRPAIVHVYHGHVLEGYFGPAKNALYRTLERSAGLVSDRLIGVSEANVDDLVRLRVAPRSRFTVVPYGLDLNPFIACERAAAEDFRRANGVREAEILLGYVGRLVPIKRVDVLLRAFAALRRDDLAVRLSIVGDGESRPELEALARDLGVDDRVRFHGFATDVAAVTAAADIAVLSSDNEGTPVALIESGAAGLPAVATCAGGTQDVLPADCGVVVPCGDHEAFADGLRRLVHDPALRARMGARARAHVLERYSVERMIRQMEGVYADVARSSAHRTTARRKLRPSQPFLQ